MTFYGFILIVHVIATFILFAALTLEGVSLYHLRRTTSAAQAQPWFAPFPSLLLYVALSGVTILVTGIVLVAHESAGGQAWAKIAALALVLTVPLGAASRRRMRAIRAAGDPEMISRLRDPLLKRSISIRIALFFGIFVLVSSKPAFWGAIGTILAAAALGLLASFGSLRGAPASISGAASDASAQQTGN